MPKGRPKTGPFSLQNKGKMYELTILDVFTLTKTLFFGIITLLDKNLQK